MPKRAIRILCMAIGVMLPLAAEAADQTHATAKAAVPQPSPAPNQSQAHPNAQPGKYVALYRDVCDKHPNLKQCS
jgi:hypothetical protein